MINVEKISIEGLAAHEAVYRFNDDDSRTIKVIVTETTASLAPDVQEVSWGFKAEAFLVNADGSMKKPEAPLALQPGYSAHTMNVPREAIANQTLDMGNEIGKLRAKVAAWADTNAVTRGAFAFIPEA